MDVAAAAADVLLQFEKREMMLNVPQKVRQKDQECNRASHPKPGTGEQAALGREEEPEDNAGAENQHRVFVFEPDSGAYAEPDPQLCVACFDHAHDEPDAAQPEQRLERVHGQQIVETEDSRRHKHRDRSEALRKQFPAQLARNHSSERNFSRSRERRQKPDGRKRIAQQ